jgi:hypothetical protein
MYIFAAYKNEDDYQNGIPFFVEETFLNHSSMKLFSAKHSVQYKEQYPEYVSDYWCCEIENNKHVFWENPISNEVIFRNTIFNWKNIQREKKLKRILKDEK